MTIIVEKQLHTVKDFALFTARSENVDRLFELIHGEIVEKVVTEEHGIIALNIGALIRAYVKPKGLGRVGVEVSHRVAGDRYNERLPDVSFRTTTSEPVVKQGSVPRMPDLAVEVKSPGNSYTSLRQKAEYMLQNGALIVWLIYPEKQIVEVCTLTDEGDLPDSMRVEAIGMNGTVGSGYVLPGLKVAVSDIFDLD